jgi:hypothetical protein
MLAFHLRLIDVFWFIEYLLQQGIIAIMTFIIGEAVDAF